MKVLVTGVARFIGSNFLHYMVNEYPDYNFVCLDELTYAGNFNNMKNNSCQLAYEKNKYEKYI